MAIQYTNRKGFTFHLCKGKTKTGKPRYFFARDLKGEPVEHIPDGYAISESVNGVVSLVKARPGLIQPREVAIVETILKRHPKAHNYRVSVKRDRIEIYERVGLDASDLTRIAGQAILEPGMRERIDNEMDRYSQFTPVLRLILSHTDERMFSAQRMCYRSWVDGWLDLHDSGKIEPLARRLIPCLGTDAFFELF
ncbi:MAG: hypothetical protein KGJ80_21010 [Chloroflexota bacterium]|nr:hypothetical protein [Chloroflexota bacterium]